MATEKCHEKGDSSDKYLPLTRYGMTTYCATNKFLKILILMKTMQLRMIFFAAGKAIMNQAKIT